jgi:hypothetical protein
MKRFEEKVVIVTGAASGSAKLQLGAFHPRVPASRSSCRESLPFFGLFRNLNELATVLMRIILSGNADGSGRTMTPRPKPPSNRKFPLPRNPAHYRFRALDDSGADDLDDWMVAYPAADLARPD